jgi:virulence factor Mce-like protein
MRRLALATALVVGIAAALVLGLGASSGPSGYRVRAIFDNAANIVVGEDVKTAGAKIGTVDSLDVTKDKKAAVVLSIGDAGFAPFRADAKCTIRPQSLIGEKYVECTLGTSTHAELFQVPAGQPGAGQHLLPLAQTSSPVDLDLVNDTLRAPFRQRLAIVLREFGTALAGRGTELNDAIHRANPALRDTDRVLAILASQNRTLAQLAADSDRVLTPLAARRKRVSDFIVQANTTGRATAERSAALEQTFQRFPDFLRQLKPTLADLGALSDEMTPVLMDLDRAAPGLNRFVLELGPFSSAATPALSSLARATDIGGPALQRSRPLIRNLADFSVQAKPVSTSLDLITRSLDKSGGIERIMDYLFFTSTSINGFDGISHYLRTELLTNLCSSYTATAAPGCNSNFTATRSIGAASKDRTLARVQAKLRSGLATIGTRKPAPASGGAPAPVNPFDALHQLVNPTVGGSRSAGVGRIQAGSRSGSRALGRPDAQEALIQYLLGNDGR